MAIEKKTCAVITYANSSRAYFPYFLRHYSKEFGTESIFVITPQPDEFQDMNLGGVISIKGFPFDDYSRVKLASSLTSGLLNYFRYVIQVDVDELLIPHPSTNLSLKKYVESLTAPYITCRGFDVLQQDDELPLELSKPIFQQRRWGVLNSSLYKTLITRVPITWGVGFHFCSYFPNFGKEDQGIFLAHMKFACRKIRNEIREVVDGTSFLTEETKKYCTNSAEYEHPVLKMSPFSKLATFPLLSERIVEFDGKVLSRISLDTNDAIYRGNHFFDPTVVTFRDYFSS